MFFEGINIDNRKIVRVEYNPVIADLTKIREVRLVLTGQRDGDDAHPLRGLARSMQIASTASIRTLVRFSHYTGAHHGHSP